MAIDVEAYYKKYGPMVFRRCKSLVRDEDTALDLMQDVFVQLLKRSDELDERGPSSLLYTIATNLCLNHIRKNKRHPETENDEILQTIAGTDKPEEQFLVAHFLDTLFKKEKESTRTIAVLHYVDKYTLEETAELVGLSVSGVRKRLRNLRAKGLKLREE